MSYASIDLGIDSLSANFNSISGDRNKQYNKSM